MRRVANRQLKWQLRWPWSWWNAPFENSCAVCNFLFPWHQLPAISQLSNNHQVAQPYRWRETSQAAAGSTILPLRRDISGTKYHIHHYIFIRIYNAHFFTFLWTSVLKMLATPSKYGQDAMSCMASSCHLKSLFTRFITVEIHSWQIIG